MVDPAMTFDLDHLPKMVDDIIQVGERDDERAHIYEDTLHLAVIRAFCPPLVVAEIDRLNDAGFARWCS